MNRAEICKCINSGADFSLRILGDAEHMEHLTYPYYEMIRPKPGFQGGASVFNVRLDDFPDDVLQQIVDEIQGLNMHVWWGFFLPERVLRAIWKGRAVPPRSPEPNDDEVAMAMLPEEKPALAVPRATIQVKKVDCLDMFRTWTAINNEVLAYPLVHPENHYHLCNNGTMSCFVGYNGDTPAAVSAILTDQGVSSLEFVGTLDVHRRKGLARAVSAAAVEDAFSSGSRLISARPFGKMKVLCRQLGFTVYE